MGLLRRLSLTEMLLVLALIASAVSAMGNLVRVTSGLQQDPGGTDD